MTNEKVRLVRGYGRGGREFEWVADSFGPEMLSDQLKALDSAEFETTPLLVLISGANKFEIFSAVRATRR